MSKSLSSCGYLDYSTAKALAERARSRDGFTIGCNTWVRHDRENVEVVYHRTPVITFHPDDTLTLRANGWTTPTTKERIARLLQCGGRLGSYLGRWFWGDMPFYDGMRVSLGGSVMSPVPQSYLDAVAFARRQVGEAAEGVDRLMADPVFRAKVRMGALLPNNCRVTSTILARKLTPRAIEELALRHLDVTDFVKSVTSRQLERQVRKGEL